MVQARKKNKSKKTSRFKVGDKIIDFGRVYRIFKVEDKVNEKGLKERILHLKPHYKTERSKGVTCSIPEKNLGLTKMRRPISKQALKKVFQKLSDQSRLEAKMNILKVREILKDNSALKTAAVIKSLWLDKKDKTSNFPASKRSSMNLSMRSLVEEVAYVSGTSVKQAKETIQKQLEKPLRRIK